MRECPLFYLVEIRWWWLQIQMTRIITWRKHARVSWISNGLSRRCHLLVFSMYMLSLAVAKQGQGDALGMSRIKHIHNIHTILTLSNQKSHAQFHEDRWQGEKGICIVVWKENGKHDYTKHETYIPQFNLLWNWSHVMCVHASTCSVTSSLHMMWASLSFHSQ